MPKSSGKAIPQVLINLKPTDAERTQLLHTLQIRFNHHPHRHSKLSWSDIHSRLQNNPSLLTSLHAMETTGGEPDIVILQNTPAFIDCSPQSPDRRSICYDPAGEAIRIKKGLKPGGNAIDLADAMGITLLTETQYRTLQTHDQFDTTTSSWILTPVAIRDLGGALFCDRRYDTIFTYHNSAESFYSARGFRGMLLI